MNITTPESEMGLDLNNNFYWSVNYTNQNDNYCGLPENDFYNPIPESPMKVSRFLSYLDIDYEPSTPINEKHFHFPDQAMLRLVPFKILKKIRWDTDIARILFGDPREARALGFKNDVFDNPITPTRRTISHFFNNRLTFDDYQNLFDHYVKKINKLMIEKNITFGERLGIDSTPLPTLKNDDYGIYNTHYNETMGLYEMAKVHSLICLDTGIPIAVEISNGVAYDGKFLIPLLYKAKSLGIDFREVYGDGAYNTNENWARISTEFNAECFFRLSTLNRIRNTGCKREIQRRYQKYRDFPCWNTTKDMKEMLKYLAQHLDYNNAADHFRNVQCRRRQYTPEYYTEVMGKRSLCETFHSILKEKLYFDKFLCKKGKENIHIYSLCFMIAIVMATYIRISNGVESDFMKFDLGLI